MGRFNSLVEFFSGDKDMAADTHCKQRPDNIHHSVHYDFKDDIKVSISGSQPLEGTRMAGSQPTYMHIEILFTNWTTHFHTLRLNCQGD